ncbi:unnamed protein product [Urochloa decumbens]|uniref:Uncharacterized protein n=1 Tax=Urochloa decumbens TaxID=240449 RepID=A0ABC9BYP6_9POAL
MALELPRPGTKTVSRCTPQTARGTHTFEIEGYSTQGLGAGKFIQSASFAIGGYDWCIRYYPDGSKTEGLKDYTAVYLELLTKKAEVRALYDFRLIDHTTKSPLSIFHTKAPLLFDTVNIGRNCYTWGRSKFKKKNELESSPFLRDDRLVIECDVTVLKESVIVETSDAVTNIVVGVPSPNLSQDLAKLLETKEEADVTFSVDGEVFAAHAIVLGMRSSVFKAEFYGPLREQRDQRITIKDIQPDVFRALLHFIYTDSMLPSMDDLDREEWKELIQQLLVAADRYDVQGLKSVCENALCERLDVETVAAMLALADQQNCNKLKSACIDFIIRPDKWDGVASSEGFDHLKRSCPSILVDVLEKAVRSRKIL